MDKKISISLLGLLIITIFAFGSCAHKFDEASPYLSEKEKKEIFLSANQKRNSVNQKNSNEFILRDSSFTERPLWLIDAKAWALENEVNPNFHEYLAYETEPKLSRNLACDLSKANIRVDLAIKLAEGFKKHMLEHIEAKVANLEKKNKYINYLNEQFPDKIQSFLKGAQVLGTYWEYREYRKDLGASTDYKAFTCASLIRIQKTNILKAIDLARDFLMSGKVFEKPDLELKAIIEQDAKDISKLFVIEEIQLP